MAEVAEETNVQAYMEGLSRLDRVVDDSGYAFTALDVVVRIVVARLGLLHSDCKATYCAPRDLSDCRAKSS